MLDAETERFAKRFQESRPKALRSDCPSSEKLWAAAAGELSFEELRQAASHSAGCAECSEALRIALELRRASAPDARLGAVLPFRARQRWVALSGAGLLAAAVALLILGPNFRTGRGPSELARDTERGGGSARIVPPPGGWPASQPLGPALQPGEGATKILSETAPGPQRRSEVQLRWTPYPSALRYNVSVMTPSFELLHRALALSKTELRVPKEALSGQPAGARLLWTVEATTANGQTVESALFTLELE
jgi:hypothetical protein